MAQARGVATEEDLRRMPDDGWKYELVDGEIRRLSPAGSRHGQICARLITALDSFARSRSFGDVFDSSTGFRLMRGNVRAPDVSFVAGGRFPEGRPPEGYSPVCPDLAVEVLSPDDRPGYVLEKIGEYLEAGVRLVWVIDPRRQTAAVHRSLTDVRQLDVEGVLDGEDVLPGFRCPLREILS